jgi:hypothetical protein
MSFFETLFDAQQREREVTFVGDTDSCIPKYVMSRPRMNFYIQGEHKNTP